MAQEGEGLRSLWQATAPAASACVETALPQGEAFDTVVIGAGVTGASAALHLAQCGQRVALLERTAAGAGSSGRANGQIIAGLQQSPAVILAAFGERCGEQVLAFAGAAPDRLFDLVARHRIDCGAERHGWIQATRWRHGLRALHRIADDWRARGAPVRMLARDEIAAKLGTTAYAGGWEDARGGVVDPLAYTRGLAAAATQAGARLWHDAEVVALAREGVQWRIATANASWRARCVILATNADTASLCGIAKAPIARSYLSAHSVQLASEPLDAQRRAQLLPERHACGDTEHLRLRYFRLDAAHRFVIGGPGWLTPPRDAGALSLRLLERSARRMFPALAGLRFEYRWAARDSLTADLLPHLYEPMPGLFAALGYNGRGLALGSALGALLARRACGEAADALPYPFTAEPRLPLALGAALRMRLRRWRAAWRH